MATYARPVERLISELSRLPSIGPRSAQRIAFHIIRSRKEEALALAEALIDRSKWIQSEAQDAADAKMKEEVKTRL